MLPKIPYQMNMENPTQAATKIPYPSDMKQQEQTATGLQAIPYPGISRAREQEAAGQIPYTNLAQKQEQASAGLASIPFANVARKQEQAAAGLASIPFPSVAQKQEQASTGLASIPFASVAQKQEQTATGLASIPFASVARKQEQAAAGLASIPFANVARKQEQASAGLASIPFPSAERKQEQASAGLVSIPFPSVAQKQEQAAAGLQQIPYPTGTQKQVQTSFSGLDRRSGAGNGAICGMENLTGDHAPLLASRSSRYVFMPPAFPTVETPNGIFAAGHLFIVDGTELYVDDTLAGTVADSEKVFAALGERVVFWPDKMIWTEDGGLESLESSLTVAGLEFADGTYAEEAAEKNTIIHPTAAFDWSDYFNVGDAVGISGTTDGANDKTAIIREIDGNELRFYENTFSENITETGDVTIARTVPDLDFLCTNENRVWGCKDDTVWCCKLGDPFNWNVFDGLSTDAWSVETGSAGGFTGCVSFLGYPCFFKEDRIFKVYGSKPSNFEMMGAATLGVLGGAHKTMAVAGETLFYLSRTGFMAYNGGMPSPIDAELARAYCGGAAGSDGIKYYVSAVYSEDDELNAELLVYDTRTRLWHREDDTAAFGMAYFGGVVCLTNAGLRMMWSCPTPPEDATEESTVSSAVEFGDWDFQSFGSKYPVRLWLRAEAAQGVTLAVSLRYDGGEWESTATWNPGTKKSGYFPVPLHRCGYYAIKITSDGPWKLWALEHELYHGADSRRP